MTAHQLPNKLEKLTDPAGLSAALRDARITVKNLDVLDNHEVDNWELKVLKKGRDQGVTGDYIGEVAKMVASLTFGVGKTYTPDELDKSKHAALALIHRAVEPEAFREGGRQ